MAHTIDFDSPASSTVYNVVATGTIAAWSLGHVMVQLDVTGTNPARGADQRYFYREEDLDNTTSATAVAFNATYQIAITPMLHGSDTVETNVWFSYPGTNPL